MMTFHDSLAIVAKDKNVNGQTMRVLMLVLRELDFEKYLNIKPVEIAKQVEMHKPAVSKAMRLRVDKGIILKA
jgi:hypothetical protein